MCRKAVPQLFFLQVLAGRHGASWKVRYDWYIMNGMPMIKDVMLPHLLCKRGWCGNVERGNEGG